jgi:hypothetical protein
MLFMKFKGNITLCVNQLKNDYLAVDYQPDIRSRTKMYRTSASPFLALIEFSLQKGKPAESNNLSRIEIRNRDPAQPIFILDFPKRRLITRLK